ncbi:MAG TPA: ribonuclease PH [Myxococcota bacterium]|nr:ribonuclease PH [Myxococcota bacterium]
MNRPDGRAADELRAVRITTDYTENPLASVLIEMGRTRVLCTVCEERSVPRWMAGRGRGWVTAEYSMLPGATDRRTDREASRGKLSGRTQEIQRLIGRSLRAISDLDALGERTLWVDCDVLQADGGTRTASITGAWVALAIAIERLQPKQNPLLDSVGAISVGVVGGELLLDLDYREDVRADVDMNVVMTGRGHFVEVQGTAEQGTYDRDQLMALTDRAAAGIAEITRVQQKALSEARRSA